MLLPNFHRKNAINAVYLILIFISPVFPLKICGKSIIIREISVENSKTKKITLNFSNRARKCNFFVCTIPCFNKKERKNETRSIASIWVLRAINTCRFGFHQRDAKS